MYLFVWMSEAQTAQSSPPLLSKKVLNLFLTFLVKIKVLLFFPSVSLFGEKLHPPPFGGRLVFAFNILVSSELCH